MLNIFIDADGCPVIEATLSIAEHFSIPVHLICDTSHYFDYEDCDMIVVGQGSDAVDFKILQLVQKNDIVVTQDYGLASLVLSKKAYAIHQNGLIFDDENILTLLNQRHDSAKIRKKTHRYQHIKKRTENDDQMFMDALVKLVHRILEDTDGK